MSAMGPTGPVLSANDAPVLFGCSAAMILSKLDAVMPSPVRGAGSPSTKSESSANGAPRESLPAGSGSGAVASMIGMLSAVFRMLPVAGNAPEETCVGSLESGVSHHENKFVQESIRDAGPDEAISWSRVFRADAAAARSGAGNGAEARSRRAELPGLRTPQGAEGLDHRG